MRAPLPCKAWRVPSPHKLAQAVENSLMAMGVLVRGKTKGTGKGGD